MPKPVKIEPNVDNVITLNLKGQVLTNRGLELAGKLNAVLAYWNSVLERNKASATHPKLHATTGPVCCPTVDRLNEPKPKSAAKKRKP